MAQCRILSIDGGGIQALMTAMTIKRIEESRPGTLAQVDIFAGTSAGGFMALMLAAADDPVEGIVDIVNLWTEWGIYSDNDPFHVIRTVVGVAPLYSNQALKQGLTDLFGDRTLGDLPRRVVIPTFQLDNKSPDLAQRGWGPMIFHNFGGGLDTFLDGASTANTKLVDVALRTSAAPVCWPVYQGYIDGGIYANNPSMCALTLALDRSGKGSTRGRPLPESPDEVVLLSMGEGSTRRFLPSDSEDWGWAQWIAAPEEPLALLDAVIDSNSQIIDYQCRRLLSDGQYHRLDPPLPRPKTRMSLDTEIPLFYKAALEVDLGPTLTWLDSSRWFEAPDGEEADGAGAAATSRRRRRPDESRRETAG